MDDDVKLAMVLVFTPLIVVAFILVLVISPDTELVAAVFMGGMAVLFIVVGIYMAAAGKGGWLIAGYNTASADEKTEYDERRLCLMVGSLLAFMGILTFVFFVYPKPSEWIWFVILLILSVVVIIALANSSFAKRRA